MRLLDVVNSPWVTTPETLREIRDIYVTHLRGEKIDVRGIEERLGRPLRNEPKPYGVMDGVAVIPIEGVMAKRMNLLSEISGGVSTQLVERDFKQALADDAVHSILLLVDSPGGAVEGTQELAQTIFASRGQKPIVALGESTIASGAYWVGSAADKLYITGDTTLVGSIGVVATHIDYSAAEEKRGVKYTEITSGRYKRIASEHRPLSAEGEATIKDWTDHIYSVFVDAVAAHRGVSAEKVLNDMADGRMFMGRRAVAAGLVDGFATLPSLVERLGADHSKAMFGAEASTKESDMAEKETPNSAPAPAPAKTYSESELHIARVEGAAEGYLKGATAERERIQSVEAAALPGHEELIARLKFDGQSTGATAALEIVAAERKQREAKLAKMRAEAPQPVPASVPGAPAAESKDQYDPAVVGKKAQEYQRAEAAKGNEISTTEAVAHVIEEMKAGR